MSSSAAYNLSTCLEITKQYCWNLEELNEAVYYESK